MFSTAPPCLPRDDALDLFLSFLVLSLGLAQHPNGTLTSWMSMPLMPVEGHRRDVQAELIRGLLTKQIPSLVLFTLLTCLPRIPQQLTLHLSAGGKHLPSANQKAPLAIVWGEKANSARSLLRAWQTQAMWSEELKRAPTERKNWANAKLKRRTSPRGNSSWKRWISYRTNSPGKRCGSVPQLPGWAHAQEDKQD